MENSEKLLKALKDICFVKEGQISTAADGQKYRYDHYNMKYTHTAYWLGLLFAKAAKENGEEHGRQFQYNGHSFYFDRAVFKGARDGKISFSKLILL